MQIAIAISVGSVNRNGEIVSTLISNFKGRVANDLGVFEAQACLDATLTILNNIQ